MPDLPAAPAESVWQRPDDGPGAERGRAGLGDDLPVHPTDELAVASRESAAAAPTGSQLYERAAVRPSTAASLEQANAQVARRLPGVRQHNRQVVTVHLSAAVRQLIDRAVAASTASPPPARGVVVMEAVRAVHEELEREFALPENDPVFGPPAVPRRQAPLDGGDRMVLRVSAAEAAALADLRERTTLSISGLVALAVQRYWATRLADRRTSGWGERPEPA